MEGVKEGMTGRRRRSEELEETKWSLKVEKNHERSDRQSHSELLSSLNPAENLT